jgi:prepilin-type N-terminal cleavage/methylation domain-containing protein
VRRFPRLRDQAGFTLIEVMVAAVVTMVGFLAVASAFDMAKRTTVKTGARDTATSLARELVEAARGIPYAEISDANVLGRIAVADPSLADDQPGLPYTVTRRNVVYTITAETCIMDDARDGGGAPPRAGDFCSNSVAAGTRDTQTNQVDRLPEDYKRVDLRVAWTSGGQGMSVRQSTLVNNPGSANAPAVVTLTGVGVPNPPVIGSTASNQIQFNLTTSSRPHAVAWLLDGSSQGLICSNCTGLAFSFVWKLDEPTVAPDGPYLVAAEAYDEQSVAGPSRSTTVILNRSLPEPPRGFAGGRNGSVVELEWVPNSERDLTGYDVQRLDGANWVTVCARSLRTTCIDTSPPNALELRYRVQAYDVDEVTATTPRASHRYSHATVIRDNLPPHPVAEVLKRDNGDGSLTLSWAKPSPQDPDSGDRIAFYRIYRGGTTVDHRMISVDAGSVDAHEHTFVDEPGHRYWVSAVDQHFAESPLTEAQAVAP